MSDYYVKSRDLPEPLALPIDVSPEYRLTATRIGRTQNGDPVATLDLWNGKRIWAGNVNLFDQTDRGRFLFRAGRAQADVRRIQIHIEAAMVDFGARLPELLATLPAIEAGQASADDQFIRFSRFIRKGFTQNNPPDVPLEAIPEPARTFVAEVSDALEVPRGYVLVPLLGALGTAIGRRVRLIAQDDWLEQSVFWLVIVGEPGDGKSAAQRAATRPLRDMHGRHMTAWKAAKQRFDLDLEAWNGMPRKDRGERPVEPIARHFYTTDSTMERLAELADRNNGLLLMKDEIASLVRALDMYRSGKGDDREKMLSLYGCETIQVDRMGRTLYVENPHVSLVGGIQPAKLPLLAGEAQQDGFVDRFAWFWVDGKMRPVDEPPVRDEVRRAMAAVFYALCDHDPTVPVPSSTFDPNADEAPTDYVKFDRHATALWRLWRQTNEQLRWQHVGPLRTAYVKFTYLACRIALVLHCVQYPYQGRTGTAILITRDTLADALRLTECFRCHTNRVLGHFDYLGTLEQSPEERVYDAICQMGGEPTSTTELQQRFQRNIPKLGRILIKLKEQGRIGFLVERDGRPGRDPHYWYALNPYEKNEKNEQIPLCLDVEALLTRLDEPEELTL